MSNAAMIDKAESSANLVPYIMFTTPSIVLNKDGSLTVLMEVEGQDADSISEEEKEHASIALENAMKTLGGRITMHWHVLHHEYNKYPNENKSNNPVSSEMVQLYEKSFRKTKHYKNKHILSLVYHAPLGADRFFDKLSFYINKQKENVVKAFFMASKDLLLFRRAFDYDINQHNLDKAAFNEMINAFVGANTLVKFRVMHGIEAESYLHRMINPASDEMIVNPANSNLLDSYLPDNYITVGDDVLLFEGNQKKVYCASVSIKDYANQSEAWFNDVLMKIKGEIRISHSFRILSHDDSRKLIEGAIKYHQDQAVPMIKRVLANIFKSTVEPRPDAFEKQREAESALELVNMKRKNFCMHNMSIFAFAESKAECDDLIREVSSQLNQLGFIAIRENVNLLSSFIGSFPGHWDYQPRRQVLSVINLADLAPINTIKSGDETNEWLTEQAGERMEAMGAFNTRFDVPFLMNFHRGSLGHTFIVGPAGAGKTVFESLLVAMYQKYNPVTFVFDKDRSCQIPIAMQGGAYINMATGNVKMNPLSLLHDRKHWAWIAAFMETLLTSRGEKYTSEHERKVWEGLEVVHSMGSENWQLSILATQIGEELFERLSIWLGDNRYGYLFDNIEDSFDIGDMTGIEMGELMKNHPMAAIAFMDYAFYRLDLKFDGKRPGIIDIQEVWFMLKNEKFAARLDDWLRTMRKRNVVVVMSTQSLQEIEDSDYTMSFNDNIVNNIFLPNSNAKTHTKVYKSMFQLNDHQIEEIMYATQNKHYYLVRADMTRLLDVKIDKELLAYLRADGKALDIFDKHQGRKMPNWKQDYLDEIAQA